VGRPAQSLARPFLFLKISEEATMSQQTRDFFEFDSFRLDAAKRLLWRADAGELVPLSPKVFETLLVLVANGGRVVEKEELMSAVWPDTAVEENNLTQNVSAIRKALGERRGEHRYVVTVPGRGYRFVADVRRLGGHAGDGNGNGNGHGAQATANAGEFGGDASGAKPVADAVARAARPARLTPEWAAVFLLLAGGIVAALWAWPRPDVSAMKRVVADASGGQVQSIAVLPFRPLGPGDEDTYTGSGMADALITKLGNTQQRIAVRPTGAVLGYVGRDYDPLAAGRDLAVDAVLDGRVQRADGRVRVTVQMFRVSDGATLWAGTFDEKLKDMFAVQDSISEQVLEALKIPLGRVERDVLHRRFTENAAAAQANAQAHFFMNKGTREGIDKALEYFRRAVELDPSYALAYGGMADCYTRLERHGVAPAEALRKGREVALKAVRTDDTVPYAHSILGRIAFHYDWDFAEAEREYRRARELNPAITHQWFGFLLLVQGKETEADIELNRFAEALPTLAGGFAEYGRYFYFKRQYERGVEQAEKAVELAPDYGRGHEVLGIIYEQQGRYAEAEAALKKAQELSRGQFGIASLAHLYASLGRRGEALAMRRRLLARARTSFVSSYDLALIHAALGEGDEAVARLVDARADGSLRPVFLRFDPRLDPLRAAPRFQEFVRGLGLPS
jgi:DNA-binding winged helix-turn-helix (wHTH) protein/TolB-like protein/Tfp pilus assembly protein PilF